MHIQPWQTVPLAFLAALNTGFMYAFATYSEALRDAFHLSQGDLDMIGNMQNAVCLISFTCGLLLDSTNTCFCCMLGGVILFVSWGLFGAIAMKQVHVSHPIIAFTTLGGVATMGSSLIVCSIFKTLTNNFRKDCSVVVSIAKSWVGLASGVATATYIGLFPSPTTSPDRLNFLYFLAGITGAISFAVAPFMRPLPACATDQLWFPMKMRVPFCFAVTVALIATTMASSVVQNIWISVSLIVLMGAPLMLVIPKYTRIATENAADCIEEEVDDGWLTQASPWEGGPSLIIRTEAFWIVFLITLCLQSGGNFVSTNLSSICESRLGQHTDPASAVVVYSAAQSTARLVTGSLSQRLVNRGFSRTWYWLVALAAMGAGSILFMIDGGYALYTAVMLSGWGFGTCFPMMVLVAADLWGTERIASNYMILDGAPGAIGGTVLGVWVAQVVYDAHADGCKCNGPACFFVSYCVMLAMQVIGALLITRLSIKATVVYKAISTPCPLLA